ncbi:MAG: hypothetical protein AB1706_03950 [Pseudomonadota bacterium]
MTDLNKERENFLQVPKFKERIERSKLKYDEIENHFSSPEWDSQTCCDEDYINSAWSGWLEKAKAQAVPEQIADDIQSWIAVESIQAMELDGETFVVGANELAEFITQLVKSESGAEG